MGLYHWLIHDQKGAYKWWNKAISEGENLSARPQLSRTFAEMGRCLCEGISEPSGSEVRRAKEPLLKAETMFRELGLHQDLEELNWVINQIGLEPSEI
jgi:hypothetical protein